jgi:hypothetical protein
MKSIGAVYTPYDSPTPLRYLPEYKRAGDCLLKECIDDLFTAGLLWMAERQTTSRVESLSRVESAPPSGEITTPESARAPKNQGIVAPFGIPAIDTTLPDGGFRYGTTHEWYIATGQSARTQGIPTPTAIVAVAAANILKERHKLSTRHHTDSMASATSQKLAVWIGRRLWPNPHFLDHALRSTLRTNCLFLDPPNDKLRLWAIDTALRSPAIGVVVADLGAISFTLSQRLLLAARAGNTIGLFCRYIRRDSTGSIAPSTAATTRWLIRSEISTSERPRWGLELLKCKGTPPRTTRWSVELCRGDDDENVPLHLSPTVADRRAKAPGADSTERSGGRKRA